MAAAVHTVVDAPAQRCIVKDLGHGAPVVDGDAARFSRAMQAEHADLVDPGQGFILNLEPLICVFDRDWDTLVTTVGVPVRDGAEVPDALDGMQWEACKVLELRYGERPLAQILDDVYRQATGFSTASKLRDLGSFLRLRVKPAGGIVVQVETVLRTMA